MKKILFFASLLSIFATSGCYDDNIEELNAGNGIQAGCDTLDSSGTAARTILFSGDVLPIFNSTCGTNNSACHDATNAIDLGGNGSLADYTESIATIDDRGEVDFMQRITHDPAIASSKWMPKGVSTKMGDCDIAKIRLWFEQGRPNN